jgi:SAM-dependent methyltransferase
MDGSIADLQRRVEEHIGSYRDSWEATPSDAMRRLTSPVEGRVLDVGCGFGQVLLCVGRTGRPELLVGVDVDQILLSLGSLLRETAPLSERVPALVAGDALRLPFADSSFDLVICRVVLMSLPVRAVLKELIRVVAPGGRLFLHLTGPGFYLRDLFSRRWRGALLGLLNGALLALCSIQIRFGALWNNFQPPGRVATLLRSSGLAIVGVESGRRLWGLPSSFKMLATRRPTGLFNP